jgi:hypothetical protein
MFRAEADNPYDCTIHENPEFHDRAGKLAADDSGLLIVAGNDGLAIQADFNSDPARLFVRKVS